MSPSGAVSSRPWKPRVRKEWNAAQGGFAHTLHLFGTFWIVFAIIRHPVVGIAALLVAILIGYIWSLRRG